MSIIANEEDAYNVGGIQPSGYKANRCCTNERAIECGCADPGYSYKRLVPLNLLKAGVGKLSINTLAGDYVVKYYMQIQIYDVNSGDEYWSGTLGFGTSYSQSLNSLEIPINAEVGVYVFDGNYTLSYGEDYYIGILNFDTYPGSYTDLENNSHGIRVEFPMYEEGNAFIAISISRD